METFRIGNATNSLFLEIKRLKKKVEELKEENEALREEIDGLERREI